MQSVSLGKAVKTVDLTFDITGASRMDTLDGIAFVPDTISLTYEPWEGAWMLQQVDIHGIPPGGLARDRIGVKVCQDNTEILPEWARRFIGAVNVARELEQL